jgi:hypothetical protein
VEELLLQASWVISTAVCRGVLILQFKKWKGTGT